jgi:hypothetical protein
MMLDACGCARVRRTVADFASTPVHGGDLREAPIRGEASAPDRLVVWLGLWTDGRGAVTRARFKATSCVSLLAYAELTCELLEEGMLPASIDAAALHDRLEGVHPRHRTRADLVVEALRSAMPPTHNAVLGEPR